MNPIDWLRNYAFDTHFDRGDSLTECHLEQSTEFSMNLAALEKELEAARREALEEAAQAIEEHDDWDMYKKDWAKLIRALKQTPQAGKEG